MNNIKAKIFFITLYVGLLFLYLSINPFGYGKLDSIDKADYSLKTHNVSKDNKWSRFRVDENGNFFIHPGEKQPVRAVFIINNSMHAVVTLSIRKGSNVGEIGFTILKNEILIDSLVIKINDYKEAVVDLEKGDVLEIIADKHGKTSSDWGNIHIEVDKYNLSYDLLIFIIWAIIIILAHKTKYYYYSLASILIFLLLLFSEKNNFGTLLFNDVMSYAYVSLLFLFTSIFVSQVLGNINVIKRLLTIVINYIFAISLVLLPISFIIYSLNFDTSVTNETIHAMLQSNSSESYEYVSDFIQWKYIVLFLSILIVFIVLIFGQAKTKTLKVNKIINVLLIVLFLILSAYRFRDVRVITFVLNSYDEFQHEVAEFKIIQEKRNKGQVNFKADKIGEGETYVVVIGESLNKRHMGIYGYFRETTPLLSKTEDLLVFNDVYSNHTHTVPVLSKSLTEANQYNKKDHFKSTSIIDILKKANFKTYWLTNQQLYGAWDNVVSVIATNSDEIISVNSNIGKTSKQDRYDGYLIDKLDDVLDKKSKENKVIFIHLMGSHGSYKSRYPNGFLKYKDKLEEGKFGLKILSKNINYYDNSVFYNDFVVSNMLDRIQSKAGVNGFIYMSDHADDVISNLSHNSSKFTYYMTEIPMIAWFSKDYKEKYNKRYNNLLERRDTLFSNDMFYDTMIGIFGVETPNYNSKFDLSNDNYTLKYEDALVMNNKKYVTNDNYIFWQKKNASYLKKTNQATRVFPHRVNTIGKLHDIWQVGFRAFELDIRFGDDNTKAFKIQYDKGQKGVELNEFIGSVNYSLIEKMWFDFKNFEINNYEDALGRLEYLDSKYDIKNKVILEASAKSDFFNYFKEKGWHTSYYLPTGKILKLIENNKKIELDRFATELSLQLKKQNVSAVSFDNRLYSFVKKHLEQKISKDIVYHIWYAPALYDYNFKNKLLKNKLYKDDRVKTLLSSFKSQYKF